MQTMKKLNLGCGTDIRPGWVNLDIAALNGVDVVHDVNKTPYPFPDDTFDEIVAQDILEHVSDLGAVMMELHRILKPGGHVKIQVPHFSSRNNYADPTHKNRFSAVTFEFFIADAFEGRSYYFRKHFSAIDDCRITFRKHPVFFWNYLVEPLVNYSRAMRNYYELTGFCRLFPGHNLAVVLRK
jgi:SAM-dependent methyltransferase